MTRSLIAATLVTAFSIVATQPCYADVIDTLDTADGFNDSFNGTTAVANGDGTVTLTRTVANVDAGINWTDMGYKIPIGTDNILRITPTESVNGGFYGVTLLVFDTSDQFLAEMVWIGDTDSTTIQEMPDVAAFVDNPSAASFVLRFRIQPYDQANAAFTFDQIEVTTDSSIPGDINGDGFVGLDDLDIVLNNWNAGTPPNGGSPSIPEPASVVLLSLGATALLRQRSA